MTVLSDRDIKAELAGGGLVLDPMPDAADYQPASIDVRICLKGGAKRPDPRGMHEIVIDADGIRGAHYFHDPCVRGLYLAPGQCALVTTRQRVEVGAHLSVEVYGRSSIARTFLTIHQTAGWVDAGFKGQITLELLYEMIRSRHGGRSYDQLLAVELIAICDYLEQMAPQTRSAQIRLRAALKKLDLPSWLNRHTTPCEACGELVLWVWTKAAKSALALDAEPAEGGIYTVEDKPDEKKRVIATCWGTPAVGGRHAHSKTCTAKAGRAT